MNLPGLKKMWFKSFEKHNFEVSGILATIICPQRPLDGTFWAWKFDYIDSFPETELALLEKGLYIAHIEFTNKVGLPEVINKWNDFYKLLTEKYLFAKKPALIGLSRGGLYCYIWASTNPDKVACIYGDAPVCDICE